MRGIIAKPRLCLTDREENYPKKKVFIIYGPGAKRIGLSTYCQDVEATAFKKDSKVILILLNRTDKDIPVYVRMHHKNVFVNVKAQSIMSGVITRIKKG